MKRKTASLFVLVLAAAILFSGCSSGGNLSDTQKWFNTSYAVLTYANKGDLNQIGGFKRTDTTKELIRQMLDSSWDVTDRASADETLDYLLTEGHRSDFAADVAYLKEIGAMDYSIDEAVAAFANEDPESEALVRTVLEANGALGEHAIDAWDYCRAMQLLGNYYIAGYYTLEESMDKSLEVAKTLQGMYTSWDEMMDSYLYGYRYWQEDDIDDPDSASAARLQVYEELKSSGKNPYTLDWNLPLEKTW